MTTEQKIIVHLFCKFNLLKYLGTFESDTELAFCKTYNNHNNPLNVFSYSYNYVVDWVYVNLDKLSFETVEY